MTIRETVLRFTISCLENQIDARLRLAEYPPFREWHLMFVRFYEAELREAQAQLRADG
jgi:hypothetical protein